MQSEALQWLRKQMERNDINVPGDPNCLMSYIEDRILPLYDKNIYKTQNADYMIRKLIVIDSVCKVLPITLFPIHEAEAILVGALADLSWTLPNHKFITHHNQSAGMLCDMMHSDPWFRKFVKDIDKIKKIILDIHGPNVNITHYHRGGMLSYVLHDVDILTAQYDTKRLINDLYHDLAVSHPKITDHGTLVFMTYKRILTRIGENGIYKLWIPHLAADPFFIKKRDLLYAALVSKDEFEKYIELADT